MFLMCVCVFNEFTKLNDIPHKYLGYLRNVLTGSECCDCIGHRTVT